MSAYIRQIMFSQQINKKAKIETAGTTSMISKVKIRHSNK